MSQEDEKTDFKAEVDVETLSYLGSDDIQLEHLGYKPEFKRDFTFLGLFSLCMSELAVLPGVAGTIWYTMGYCGLVGMTWGWFVAWIMGQFLAHSLAELSSAYPTSGGLYYWAFMTAAPKYKKISCYVVAWSMIISTPLSCCSITYSAAQMLIAACQLAYPNYNPAVWHIYLVYIAMMFASYIIICLPTRYVSHFNIWAAFLGVIILLVITILLPVKAPELNSGKDIFTVLYNQTGWPDGWAFCLTFMSAAWTISGYDVAAHVAEETSNASVNVPRAIIASTWASGALGFVFLISLALCSVDIDALVADPLGQPIGTLIANILGPRAGVAILVLSFLGQFGCSVAFFVAASRIFFAYSRDKALPFSDWLSTVSPTTQTPNNASLVVFVLSAAFGAISVGSDTAFQAFFSGSLLAGQVAYILPVLGRCLYENNPDYKPGPYSNGRFSRVIRYTAVAWNFLIMPLVSFPSYPMPAPADMNWAIAIYAPFQIIALGYWYFYGYKTFTGPRPNLRGEERERAHPVIDDINKETAET